VESIAIDPTETARSARKAHVMMDIRLPRYTKTELGSHIAEYAGFVGRGPLPAEALSDLLRQIASGDESRRVGLTERERAVLTSLLWLVDTDHVRYHDTAVARAQCTDQACVYASQVLTAADDVDRRAKAGQAQIA
jgi:hypothetical protein